MMPAKAPRRCRDPEVPISEAAHIDSISTDRLPHLASKHRAVGELVEVLQPPQVETAGDPDSLEVPEVLAIREHEPYLGVRVEDARARFEHVWSDQVVSVDGKDVAAMRDRDSTVASRAHARVLL